MKDVEAKNEIIKYLVSVLEKPAAEYNGWAPCPFAKAERLANKLYIGVYDSENSQFADHVRETLGSGDYESGLYALFTEDKPETIEKGLTKKFQKFLSSCLKKEGLTGYVVICLNPNQDYNVAGMNVRKKSPFFLINVIKKAVVVRGNKSLRKTNYYDNYPIEYLNYLNIPSGL